VSEVVGVRLIRTLRHRRCLSLEEFVREAKVSRQTVWRAERGESINPASARALCTYLKYSPEELGLCVRGAHGPFFDGAREHDDMQRRELLSLINVAGATLGLPALHDLDWSRLDAVTTGRARVDTGCEEQRNENQR
jgi:transcriptional regulator with XRE-family HTH domain